MEICIVTLQNYRKLRKFHRRKHKVGIWKDIRKIIIGTQFIVTIENYRKVRKCMTKDKG